MQLNCRLVCLLLCLTSNTIHAQRTETPANAVVQSLSGPIRGYISGSIYTFKGIPYASAKRFMPPQPVQAWQQVRSALSYGPVCPQAAPKVINESEFFFQHDFGFTSEDCLLLNIWTPSIKSERKRPVMVWLHGGGFATGSSNELLSYDGENLSNKGGVVVVNLNHRLNVLGYLDLSAFGERYRHSANNGMLDIVAALQWIQQNIELFGGDPGNITIFGQSGGGRKVTALLSMPTARGLFHKAIIQSGASLAFFTKSESQRIGKLVIQRLGLNERTIDSIRYLPYETIRQAGDAVLKQINEEYQQEHKTLDGFNARWSPALDELLLPYQPSDPRSNEFSKNIPIIIGSNKHEFVAAFNTMGPFNLPSEEEAMYQIARLFPGNEQLYAQHVRNAYPHAKRPLDLLEIDYRTRAASIKLATVKSQASPVYLYQFTWESPVLDGRFRSAHCLELPFVFNNVERCRQMTGGGAAAVKLGEMMSGYWINFARNGNPNAHKFPGWRAYTPANGFTQILDNQVSLRANHDKDLLAFFENKQQPL